MLNTYANHRTFTASYWTVTVAYSYDQIAIGEPAHEKLGCFIMLKNNFFNIHNKYDPIVFFFI
jgi:hypothetical protein